MPEEFIINQKPTRPPTHPGELLADILPELDMSITMAAKHLKISRVHLQNIIGAKKSITPETALKLARFCGNTAEFWLDMQQECDLWKATKRMEDRLEEIPYYKNVGASIPLSEGLGNPILS